MPEAECEAANSKVMHKPSGRSLDYGALAADAAKIKLGQEPAIRTPDKFKLIGQSLPRLDTPLKINGAAKFAIDTQIPGMVYAAIAACPVPGGKLKSVDETPVKGRRGIQQVVKLADAVAVVADRFWRAKEALALLKPEWETGAAGKTDSAQFAKLYRDTLDGPMASARNDGDVDAAFAKSANLRRQDRRGALRGAACRARRRWSRSTPPRISPATGSTSGSARKSRWAHCGSPPRPPASSRSRSPSTTASSAAASDAAVITTKCARRS